MGVGGTNSVSIPDRVLGVFRLKTKIFKEVAKAKFQSLIGF